ncbi:type II secretion system protein [Candidatus Roizmanbacteria bacterium]|nr:type II secretion system protein [Candidatus Roizmanbacteria bacterium]
MNKKLKGYTLIELLIFIGMLSILLGILSQVFSSIIDARLESESTSSVVQDGNFLLNRFSYDIAKATNVNRPSAVGTSDTTLDLTIDSANYVYALNGGSLELTINSSAYQLNGINTNISNLNFKRIGNDDGKDTIQLNYSVTSKTQRASGPESKSYQTTVGLR